MEPETPLSQTSAGKAKAEPKKVAKAAAKKAAQAKPKAKPKAAAKAKGSATPKRKQKSDNEDLETNPKAAAKAKGSPKPVPKKKGNAKDAIRAWSKGLDEREDSDNPGDDDGRKDRSNDFKFQKMLAEKSLPEFVVEEWEKSEKMKTGRQEVQRKLINKLFQKRNGKIVMSLDDEYFETLKDIVFILFRVYYYL